MWSQLSEFVTNQQRFILATVTETGGSTPRGLGAQIAITEGQLIGTIGGGALEKFVIDAARRLLQKPPNARVISWLELHLSNDLGMCCGGKVTIMLQDYVPSPQLFIFGAGHIGQVLAKVAHIAGFKVTVIDEREEWTLQKSFDEGIQVICDDSEHYLKGQKLSPYDYVVVTTYDHSLDQRLISELTKYELSYLGLIGSKAKWLRFTKRLKDISSPDRLSEVRCPMGLSIGAQTPEEIAISVVAELISTRRQDPPHPSL